MRVISLGIKVEKSDNKSKANREVWGKCRELFTRIQAETPEFIMYRFIQRKENEADAISLVALESKIPKNNTSLKSYFHGSKNRILGGYLGISLRVGYDCSTFEFIENGTYQNLQQPENRARKNLQVSQSKSAQKRIARPSAALVWTWTFKRRRFI